jgi:hypothetical protein
MAAKKKKSQNQRNKRKQAKLQRRAARVSKRPPLVAHRQADGPGLPLPGASLLKEIAPLFGDLSAPEPSLGQKEQLANLVWDSNDLVAEPELAEIVIAPLDALNAFIESTAELGYEGPDALEELDEEKRDEAFEEILSSTIVRLNTDDLREEIIAGLEDLRQRLRSEDRPEDAQRAAATQLFVKNSNIEGIAVSIGLVRAIVLRGIEAGLALMGAVGETVDLTDTSPRELNKRFGIPDELAHNLLDMPGMQPFMEKQLDRIWDDGIAALYEGELDLQIYSEEEKETAGDIFMQTRAEDPLSDDASAEEFIRALIPQLAQFLDQTFTPERIQQLRSRLDEIVDDRAYGETRFVPFLMMMHEDLAEADTIDDINRQFLITSLPGEIRTMVATNIDEDEPTQS